MKVRNITLALATLALMLPTAVKADEIKVETPNVYVRTGSNGDIDINSNGNNVNLDDDDISYSSRSRYQYRDRHRNHDSQYHSCQSRHTYSQQSTQISRSGNRVTQTQVSQVCR